MFRKFETVEEADEYIGRTVMIENVAASLIQIKIINDSLNFTFEYEDGTTEILNSELAFATVQIDGHLFGYYEHTK